MFPQSLFIIGSGVLFRPWMGMQGPITFLSTVLLNVATYLVLGGLIWLGLRPPRSITFLAIVAIIYVTAVSVAGLCEWLLA